MHMNHLEKQALTKCMTICSKAEKCVSDIRKKLIQWEISDEVSQEIIDRLISEKFIDEERFARYYARDKFRFNQWGKVKISYQMKMKQISSSIIQNALNEIDAEDYRAVLSKLLEEKTRKTKFKNEFDKKAKLIRFAQGKGFEYDLIQKELGKIIS